MERLDSNYILNAIFQSGGTVDVREDSNFILNTVFDSTNNALKVGLSGDISVDNILASGNVTVDGDLYVNGTVFSSSTEDIYISANTLTLNSGEAGSGVTAGYAGIVVDRGQDDDYVFIFDEATDSFQIGETGNTQAVATREATPTDDGIAYWDAATNKFVTSTTVLSGSTDINTLFADKSHVHAISDVTDLTAQLAGKSATGHTHVSTEVTDLGDLLATKANLSGASFTGAITSGGTDLYSIFLTTEAHVGDVVSVAAEDANVTIGGTGANPTVGLADNVGVVNLSATTFYSGSTELSTLFGTGAGTVTSVSAGDANIEIGGTAADPTVSLADSPSLNNVTASGLTTTQTLKVDGLNGASERFLSTTDGNIAATYEAMDIVSVMSAYTSAISCTDLSATTIYSGSTNINSLFLTAEAHVGDVVSVASGDGNVTIGGTAANPTIAIADSPSFNGITASGTCEAAIITSGGTNLYSIFANASHTHTTANVTNLDNLLATKANLSAATFTGAVTIPIATSNLSGAGYTSQGFAISDETTAIASAATASLTYYAPFTMIVTDTFACLTTSGSTSSTFDIHLTGTTIFSTKITIDANEFTTDTALTAAVITGTTITKGQKVELFIDAAGTGAKGAKIFINGYKA